MSERGFFKDTSLFNYFTLFVRGDDSLKFSGQRMKTFLTIIT